MGISSKQKNTSKVMLIPIGKLRPNPNQPRKQFDHDSLLSLAESIKQNGILQPLTVRPQNDGTYELVAGERRMRASLIAGYTQVPCIEVEMNDLQSAVMSLLENLQREDLNFFEEADGIAKLIETCGLTQEEVATKLGKKQSTIANKLRLLRLNDAERKRILDAVLTERHARALLRLEDKERARALNIIISHKLNVFETDRLVEDMIFPKDDSLRQHQLPVIKDVRLFINTINNAVNLLKKAGIEAVSVKQDMDEYLEYTIRIPKSQAHKQPA